MAKEKKLFPDIEDMYYTKKIFGKKYVKRFKKKLKRMKR